MRLPDWRNAPLQGKAVLLRVDYNVPVEGDTVTNDFRLRMTIPTLTELRLAGARIVVMSHLGRPKGRRKAEHSLEPVAEALGRLLERPVQFVDDVCGERARAEVDRLGRGEILCLQNLRFEPGEEKNDADFARRLAALGDIYVNDAFGTLHRKHASVCAITRFLPSYAGPLILRETEVLFRVRTEPELPFVAIFGGAKVADKIALVNQFVETADVVLVGGAMAYTFLAANGVSIGDSLCEAERFDDIRRTMARARQSNHVLALPEDHVAIRKSSRSASPQVFEGGIPAGHLGMDIGPKTADRYASLIRGAKTVLWNGPMGVFERERFSAGTAAVARAIGRLHAYTVLCGGDTIAAVERYGNIDRFSYVSTGGGAALQFLQNPRLPGIRALLEVSD